MKARLRPCTPGQLKLIKELAKMALEPVATPANSWEAGREITRLKALTGVPNGIRPGERAGERHRS